MLLYIYSRGIQQVGPLSPYSFCFIVDVLYLSISIAVTQGELRGIRMKWSCPTLSSHLLSAYDRHFYVEASASNGKKLKEIMELYCQASRWQVSFNKSSLFLCKELRGEDELAWELHVSFKILVSILHGCPHQHKTVDSSRASQT